MKTTGLDRHALTKHDDGRGRGSQLPQEGIDYASDLGATPCLSEAVFVSVVPRLETAIATGFAVQDVLDRDPALWEAGRFRE